jgi:hypothetical protein
MRRYRVRYYEPAYPGVAFIEGPYWYLRALLVSWRLRLLGAESVEIER